MEADYMLKRRVFSSAQVDGLRQKHGRNKALKHLRDLDPQGYDAFLANTKMCCWRRLAH